MDDSEKLTALKKAYAEIILNTTKEAAVRIMESERKAMRFQQELSVAKEESLRMLMRLKQMLDAKASEAKLVSIAQQKKIEELESQLQEAEDIVKDLRDELREVQAELEGQSTSQIPASKQNCTKKCSKKNDAFGALEDKKTGLSESGMIPELVAVSNTKNFTLNGSHEGSDCYPKDLASILMRLKEPGLGINRCSQRIRACQGDLDGEQVNGNKRNPNQETARVEKISGTAKLSKEEGRHKMEGLNLIKKRNCIGVPKSFREKRKRSNRFRSAKTSSFMNIQDNPTALQNRSCSVNSLVSSSSPVFPSDGDNVIVQTGPSDVGTDLEFCRPFQSSENAKASAESHSIEQDKPPAEDSCLAVDSNKLNVSHGLNTGSSDKAETVLDQSPTSKVIKYTFQRKRRRGDVLSSSDQNRSVEEKDEKKKIVTTDNLEPKSQSLKSESSQDGRRLVQVARQLISLSGKKW